MPADGGAATAALGVDDLEAAAFEGESRWAAAGGSGAPELRLGAWEGPLDLLLELARAGKVDLARLSLLGLAEQFGAALRDALAGGRAPLCRLGDWLVMAAQLAWLRSRLLLPEGSREGEEGRREVEALRRRLADREHARRLADWLERRPRLGRDVFVRGRAADGFEAPGQAAPQADIVALLRACLVVLEKGSGSGPLPSGAAPALARPGRPGAAAPDAARHGAGGRRAAGALPARDAARSARHAPAAPRGAGQHAPGRAGAGARRGRGLGSGRDLRLCRHCARPACLPVAPGHGPHSGSSGVMLRIPTAAAVGTGIQRSLSLVPAPGLASPMV